MAEGIPGPAPEAVAANPSPGGYRTAAALFSVVSASALARGLGLVRGALTARLLSPDLYGTATLVSALNGYAQYADLGSSTVAYRELSAATGTGEDVRVKSRWLASFKLSSTLLAAVMALAAVGTASDARVRTALVAFPAVALASAAYWVLLVQAQARGRVREFSRATAVASIADVVLGIGGTLLWGLNGLLAAFMIAPALAGAWLVLQGGFEGPGRVPAPVVRSYVWTGLPLVVLGFLDHNLVYVDHLIVLGFFGVRELGIYNVALIASDAVRVVGTAVGAVMGPRLIRDYARARTVHAIREHTLLPVHMLACGTPFVIAVVWIGAGYGVPLFYPAYVETLPPLRILLIATYLLVVNGGVTTFLFALDKHRRNLLILTPVLALNVVLDVVLVKAGWGTIGVAVGSAVTYLIYTLVHLWYVAQHFSPSRAEWARFYFGAFAPGLWAGVVLVAIDANLSYAGSASRTAAALALAMLCLSPLGLRGLRLVRQLDAMA